MAADIKNLFHEIRKEGNQANHAVKGDQGRAITLMRYARQAAVWFYRTHNAAIKLCATRPRDLTRQALKELQVELDKQGFSETRLRVAWRETKNIEIAATIIGYIRNAILDSPLEPFEDRVNKAMATILTPRQWTGPQRKWLERFGKQFKENTLVDRDAFNQGQFREHGGFDRLNKVFDGQLAELLAQITDEIWSIAA